MKKKKLKTSILALTPILILALYIFNNSLSTKNVSNKASERKIASIHEEMDKKELGSGAGRAFFLIHPHLINYEFAIYKDNVKNTQKGQREIASVENNLPKVYEFRHWGILDAEPSRYFY
jgi:hypothetical protein